MRHVPCVVLKVVMGPVVGKRCVPSVFLKGVMSPDVLERGMFHVWF